MATLIAVAVMASLMINLENARCPSFLLKAIRFAINTETFKWHFLLSYKCILFTQYEQA